MCARVSTSDRFRARGKGGFALGNFTIAELSEHVGRELGVSDWVTIEQSRIDDFADCTGDRQWIHVDVERAKRESPFRGPIAHGYLMCRWSLRCRWRLESFPRRSSAASSGHWPMARWRPS